MKWKNRNPNLSDEFSRLTGLDPYELLNVPRNATKDEVKTAYLTLVKVYHPDKADPFMKAHNEQIIKLINLAYGKLIGRFAENNDESMCYKRAFAQSCHIWNQIIVNWGACLLVMFGKIKVILRIQAHH